MCGDLSISLHPLMPVLPADLLSGQVHNTEADQESRDQADVDGPVDDSRPVVRIEDQSDVNLNNYNLITFSFLT